MFWKKDGKESVFDMLIVGLGNPGLQYDGTRHNAGFEVIDAFCKKHSVTLDKNKYDAVYADVKIGDKRLLIMKPQTYMNHSGQAVSAVMRFYKIPAAALLVVSDDISLAPGKMRIRKSGSAGGQKGLNSIIEHISTNEFLRIKMGVGDRPDRETDLANWVLGKMNENDRKLFDSAKENAVKAIETVLRDGADTAMNRYSR